jgi:hypothetical protein
MILLCVGAMSWSRCKYIGAPNFTAVNVGVTHPIIHQRTVVRRSLNRDDGLDIIGWHRDLRRLGCGCDLQPLAKVILISRPGEGKHFDYHGSVISSSFTVQRSSQAWAWTFTYSHQDPTICRYVPVPHFVSARMFLKSSQSLLPERCVERRPAGRVRTFSHTQPTDRQHIFEVHLGGRERIKVKTYNGFCLD